MGGFGSGERWSKRRRVEACLMLSATRLLRTQVLVPGRCTSGWLSWHRTGAAETTASLDYQADLRDAASASLRLCYRVRGDRLDYRVRLVTTRPNYGGRRWWFLCPLRLRDDGQPLRVAKLYLPPGARMFGSRQAHGLTYASCQESGRYRGLFRSLAAELGVDERQARRAMRRFE